ncbi:hypothetical protein SVIOM342S_04379 [Streptomyces violaceorubidus]
MTLAHGLETLPRPKLDPEVKVVQRAQLVAAFEAMLQEGTASGGAADTRTGQRRARGALGRPRRGPARGWPRASPRAD